MKEIFDSIRSVRGQVKTTQNIPVPDIQVEAFEKEIGKTTFLGRDETNEDGFYLIKYDVKGDKTNTSIQVDLYVQCYDSDRSNCVRSELLLNAPQNSILNLTIPKKIRPKQTISFKLFNLLAEFFSDIDSKGVKHSDIEYIASRIKINECKKWAIEDWKGFVRENILPLVEKDSETTIDEYAQMLSSNFKERFPMVDLIQGLEKSAILSEKKNNGKNLNSHKT